ncbi:hypothetical protein D3C76_1566120 [compost metagenome]
MVPFLLKLSESGLALVTSNGMVGTLSVEFRLICCAAVLVAFADIRVFGMLIACGLAPVCTVGGLPAAG